MSETVSAFVLKSLHEHGVGRIYGYPGDGINGILVDFHENRRGQFSTHEDSLLRGLNARP